MFWWENIYCLKVVKGKRFIDEMGWYSKTLKLTKEKKIYHTGNSVITLTKIEEKGKNNVTNN